MPARQGPNSRRDHGAVEVPDPARARCHRCHPDPERCPLINPNPGLFEQRPQPAASSERGASHPNAEPAERRGRADMCVRVGLDVDFSLKQLKALSVPSLSHGFLLPVRSLVPLNWG